MHAQPHAELMEMKRWADRGLYEAIRRNLGQLSVDDIALLRLVLDHIQVVDRIFRHHLEGVPHAYKAARSEALPEIDALAEGAADADDWYASYAAGLNEHALKEPIDFVFTSGKPARMTRGEILMHVCLHGTYHRGNVGALLQLRGLTPGRDAVTDYLEDTWQSEAA